RRLRAGDREAVVENKERYAGNAAIGGEGSGLFDRGHVALAGQIAAHALYVEAADLRRQQERLDLGEIGAFAEAEREYFFDDSRPRAVCSRQADQAVRVERVRLPRNLLEMEFDAFLAAEPRQALVRGADALVAAEFARQIIDARHAFARHARIEKIGPPMNF